MQINELIITQYYSFLTPSYNTSSLSTDTDGESVESRVSQLRARFAGEGLLDHIELTVHNTDGDGTLDSLELEGWDVNVLEVGKTSSSNTSFSTSAPSSPPSARRPPRSTPPDPGAADSIGPTSSRWSVPEIAYSR